MFEIERKFRVNAEEYKRLVTELTKQFGTPTTHRQADQLFLNGHGFDTHVVGQPLLRLRDQDGQHIFTYKRTVLETGNRVEHETPIEDPHAVEAIISELGWQEAVTINKQRLEFHSDTFTYALDNVDTIGTFIEIEYVQASDDPDAEAKLFTEASRLGLNPAVQCEPKNYGVLVWEESRV